MANISTEKKQEMQAGAGSISYESLAEGLNKQLQDAYKSKASFQAYKPEAVANAEAIGSFEGRAPGESPVDIRAQGITTGQAISAAASGTQKNILDVLTSMMNLKKEQEATKQRAIDNDLALKKMKADLAEKGLTIGDDGEPRAMTPEEKDKMMLDGLDDVTASYLELFKNGSMKKISEIPAADRGKVVQALAAKGVNPEEISRSKEGKDVEGIIKTLYDRYAVSNDLSKGRLKGTMAGILGAIGLDAPVKKYNDLKKGVLSSIRNFVGEKGIMTEPDAQRIQELLPSPTDTDEEAIMAWQDINSFFKSKYGYDVIPDAVRDMSAQSSFDKEWEK